MKGQSVQVRYLVEGEPDWGGNVTTSLSDPVEVENVLVAPGDVTDVDGSTRPDGVDINQTLYFPKTYIGPSLKDGEVDAGLGFLKVIGVPSPYPNNLTPTDWNMVVKVGRVDG